MFNKKLLLAFFLILFLSLVFLSGIFKEKGLISPLVPGTFNNVAKTPLEKEVNRVMYQTEGRFAIFIKNYNTEEIYHINEQEKFDSGSLYKLWLMASSYQKIKDGKLQESDQLSGDIEKLNSDFEIEPEGAELKKGKIKMTVIQALNQMITISHNYAALLLTEKIGVESISKFLTDYKFLNSSIGGTPKTTASDIADFYQKLYLGEIIDKEYSQKMIELLKKQQLNNGLPKYLPSEVEIGHKTGEIGWFKHDAGIVYSPKGNYIIVVLSETNSPTNAQEKIAFLSKVVFDYFNQ